MLLCAPGEIIESRVAEDSSTRSGSRFSFARGLGGLSGRGRGPRRVPAPRRPGRSFIVDVVRTEDLKSPCDAPKGRIRPGVFSVHTPCLIHFNFLDWLLLAVAHVVQNQRNIRSERLRRFTNIISAPDRNSRFSSSHVSMPSHAFPGRRSRPSNGRAAPSSAHGSLEVALVRLTSCAFFICIQQSFLEKSLSSDRR